MNQNIMFARIGWGHRYVGEDLKGNFSEPNESNSWWERFNFTVARGNRCYGFVPPLGPFSSPPNPTEKTDFLVILCSRPRNDDPLKPVGWYENATFEATQTDRPKHPGLKPSLRPLWNKMQYSFSTDAESTYLIPVENRRLFDPVPTTNFGRSFIYARLQGDDRYPELAAVAKRILAMKRYAQCLGTPHIGGALMNDLQAAIDKAANALEAEENITTEEARRRILVSMLERPHQAEFRAQLMQTYGRCTISECDCPDVLEAAHIVRVADGGSDHVTNGLVLRADLHRLFDSKKLTIHPTKRTVVVAPELKDTIYGQYNGKPVMAPSKLAHAPAVQWLKKHFDLAGL